MWDSSSARILAEIKSIQRQQLQACTKDNKARVWCIAVDGINCTETKNNTFTKELQCKWTNGYRFVLLSVFLGMLGYDRLYLAIGLMKLCTLGFMFLGQLVDIVLIAMQVVGPADGSTYIIPYYVTGVSIIRSGNTTYRLPRDHW